MCDPSTMELQDRHQNELSGQEIPGALSSSHMPVLLVSPRNSQTGSHGDAVLRGQPPGTQLEGSGSPFKTNAAQTELY